MSNFLFAVLLAGVVVFVGSVAYYQYILVPETQRPQQTSDQGPAWKPSLDEFK